MCSEIDQEFNKLNREDIVALTDYAVEIRYIDDFYFPSIEEAKLAIELAEEVKNFVFKKLQQKRNKL